MKILSFDIILSLLVLGISYKDDDTSCNNLVESFVLGFDPCTTNGSINKAGGYIITIPSKGDTAVTYNFPKDVKFPIEYFSHQFYCIFPDSALDDFPVKINYRFASAKEKREQPIFICRADIDLYYFNNYVKDRQIIIECVKPVK